MKFKPGDKIMRIIAKHRITYKPVPYKITGTKNGKYVVSNANGVRNLHLGLIDVVDVQFDLESILASPLAEVMKEEDEI